MGFNCWQCGACCKLVPDFLLAQNNLPRAPNGGCGHLDENNLCKIYDTRPDICSVEKQWAKQKKIPYHDYMKLTEVFCHTLEQKVARLSETDT